jgi:hypothetical protein
MGLPTGEVDPDPGLRHQLAAQRNETPDAGPPLMTDIWIDDVYFIE